MHDNGRYVKLDRVRDADLPSRGGLSTGCTKGCENVEKGNVRKLRPLPVLRACIAPCASLECRLRRARSASRSKPNLRAVREGRKAKAKGQQERWTKAKPARRNLWSDTNALAEFGYEKTVDCDQRDTLSVSYEQVEPRLFGVVPT